MKKIPFLTLEKAKEIREQIPTPFHVYDEAGIRANFDKLQGIAKKKTPAAAQPASKGVDVSAEDFDEA